MQDNSTPESLRSDAQKYRAMETQAREDGKPDAADNFKRYAEDCDSQALALESAPKPEPTAPKMRSRIVRNFEVESFGVDHAQYFRGVGVSGTDFDEVALGAGNSEREALEDAIEQLCQGEWSFDEEQLQPPDATDYSETDSVGELLAENRPSIPDARFAVRLYPHNGCGPIALHAEDFDTKAEALAFVGGYLDKKRAAGFEVAEVEPFERWESQRADSGVGDDEGIIVVEVSNSKAIAQAEKEAERFDDADCELHFYVALFVSDKPDGDECSESECIRYTSQDDSTEWLFAPNAEEAEKQAIEEARSSLWAFQLDFLRSYMPSGLSSRALESLKKAQETLCEDFGDIASALLGEREDEALRDAVATDGAAHFLAQYDGNEVEDEDGALRFRTN